MSPVDSVGRSVCAFQGQVFERSMRLLPDCGSAVFVRRFMRSEEAWRVDTMGSFDDGASVDDVIRMVHAEYGGTPYGSELYPSEALYWMGYVYRYWCIGYGWNSRRAYALCGAREMRELYYAYHTLDPGQCIERILESKGETVLSAEDRDADLYRRGVETLRRIRAARGRS